MLLSRDFTRIVLISILIALPVSYLTSTYWLSNFAYRINLEWWYFISAGLIALGIAWITVGSQAIRAARVNPSKCLKEE
jgi:ABC-type antimicrobial peptide transport system permease subunit